MTQSEALASSKLSRPSSDGFEVGDNEVITVHIHRANVFNKADRAEILRRVHIINTAVATEGVAQSASAKRDGMTQAHIRITPAHQNIHRSMFFEDGNEFFGSGEMAVTRSLYSVEYAHWKIHWLRACRSLFLGC